MRRHHKTIDGHAVTFVNCHATAFIDARKLKQCRFSDNGHEVVADGVRSGTVARNRELYPAPDVSFRSDLPKRFGVAIPRGSVDTAATQAPSTR